MLQFLLHAEDDAVWEITFKGKCRSVISIQKPPFNCNKNYLYSIHNNKIVMKFTLNEN